MRRPSWAAITKAIRRHLTEFVMAAASVACPELMVEFDEELRIRRDAQRGIDQLSDWLAGPPARSAPGSTI